MQGLVPEIHSLSASGDGTRSKASDPVDIISVGATAVPVPDFSRFVYRGTGEAVR
jgi:hypothetical protein